MPARIIAYGSLGPLLYLTHIFPNNLLNQVYVEDLLPSSEHLRSLLDRFLLPLSIFKAIFSHCLGFQ